MRKDAENAVQTALSFVNYFLLAFGLIALLVGTFIIYNTFSMIVAQRLRELALLRAIGASRRQVSRSVLFEASIIGLIGALLGLAGGVGLAYGLAAFLDAVGSGLPGGSLVLSARTVIVSLVVGIGVTLISAYAPARRAAKIPPVAAMRAEFASTGSSLRVRTIIGAIVFAHRRAGRDRRCASAKNAGTGASLVGLGLLFTGAGALLLSPKLAQWVIGVVGVIVRPFGAVGRLARTNAVRNPRRTAATAFALTVGLLLVSAIGVVGASTKANLDSIIDTSVKADFIITGTDNSSLPPAASVAASKVSGIADVRVDLRGRADDQRLEHERLGRRRRPVVGVQHEGAAGQRHDQRLEPGRVERLRRLAQLVARADQDADPARRRQPHGDDHRHLRRQPAVQQLDRLRRHAARTGAGQRHHPGRRRRARRARHEPDHAAERTCRTRSTRSTSLRCRPATSSRASRPTRSTGC